MSDIDRLITMLDQQLAINQKQHELTEQHYQDMKMLALSFANLSATMMGHVPQTVEPTEKEEYQLSPAQTGGELS